MRHSEHSEESKKGNIMGKMKEQNIEQEEKEVTEENTVIEAPGILLVKCLQVMNRKQMQCRKKQ